MSDTKRSYLTVLGLNHNTAPVEIREKMYVKEEDIPHVLQRIKERGIDEAVIVSTCNRTEIYCHSPEQQASEDLLREVFLELFQAQPEWLNFVYTLGDEDAYRHLFLVASGLDSLVIGEPEILGQVKNAYKIASTSKATGYFTNKIFHKAFNVAKRIRTETKIGYNPLSISSMAIEMAKKIFGDLREKKILLIGAGEMCQTALKYFQKEGLEEVFVINRTYQNALKVAEEIMGAAYPFEELPGLLLKVDMVLTSTGSEKPLIDRPFVQGIMRKRKQRPLFFIDIAVPRDIEPDVNNIGNVYLYDIDDLKELSQKHFSERVKESEKAHSIIDEELAEFSKTLQQADVAPVIAQIVKEAEKMRTRELNKVMRRLKSADSDVLEAIDAMTKTITNKLIHPHIALIKQNDNASIIETLKDYFQSEEDNEEDMDHWDKRK